MIAEAAAKEMEAEAANGKPGGSCPNHRTGSVKATFQNQVREKF